MTDCSTIATYNIVTTFIFTSPNLCVHEATKPKYFLPVLALAHLLSRLYSNIHQQKWP